MAGWVKVDRSIQDHWLWSEKPFSKAQAWIDLILGANHKKAKFMIKHRLVEVDRGQQARSEITLSKEWGWSRDKVRRFLKLLESDGMVIQQKTNVTTLLTICNYEGFQSGATPSNTPDDTPDDTAVDTPTRQQSIHKQECNKEKKVKNEKNYNLSSNNDESKKVDNCPHDSIAKLYMEILPELPRVAKLTDKRKKMLGATWKSDERFRNREFWTNYFETIKKSDFLMGKTGSGWNADFDFVINQNKVIKIIEGGYE